MASPRCEQKHNRHGRYSRVRYSKQLKAFLAAQATRLSSTAAAVYAELKEKTAYAITQET